MKTIYLILILGLITTGTASGASISIEPSAQTVNVSDTFSVNVTVDPSGQETAGFQFNLDFNASVVNVNSVTEGNCLKQGGASTYFNPGTIDNIAGTVSDIYDIITTPGANVSTPGTCAIISLTAKANGFSRLDLANAVVSDPSGAVIVISIYNGSVTVGQGNPPVANCGPDRLRCENVGAPVLFNGSASNDPDGTIVSYEWNFGDGTTGSGLSTTHKYTGYNWNGSAYTPFTVTLKVTDNDGHSGSVNQKVIIWIPGDANGDGKVNILDAAIIGLKWNSADPCADLNNDGKVNIFDASIIGLNWNKVA